MSRDRIGWIDVLKAFGIVAIFSGHMGSNTGNLYNFVFRYHVPLFFFASGLFAIKNTELSLWQVIKKKIYQILVPYSFLIAINMIVLIILNEADFITYIKYIKQFIWGIRNQLPVGAMWFFSCLFSMSIIFEVLRRILKKKSLLFIGSLLIYLGTITILPNSPNVQPSWFFNLDSALYYLIYYTIGYVVSDSLLSEKYRKIKCRYTKILSTVGVSLLFVYIYTVYMKNDYLGNLIGLVPVLNLFYPILRAMLLILGNIVLAKTFEKSSQLSYVGSQTLWLCGNESIAKNIVKAMVGILGFSIDISNALEAIIYAGVLILLIICILMPIEKVAYECWKSFLGLTDRC